MTEQPQGGPLRFRTSRPESLLSERLSLLSFDRRWLGAVLGWLSLASLVTIAPFVGTSLRLLIQGIQFGVLLQGGRIAVTLDLVMAYGLLSAVGNVVTLGAGFSMYRGWPWGRSGALLGIALSAVADVILVMEARMLVGSVLWESCLQTAGSAAFLGLLVLLIAISPAQSPAPSGSESLVGNGRAHPRPPTMPSDRSFGVILAVFAASMLVTVMPSVFNNWTGLAALHPTFPPPAWFTSLLGSTTLWAAAAVIQVAGGAGMYVGSAWGRPLVYGGAALGVVANIVGVPGYLSTSPGSLAWTALGIPIGYLLIEVGVGYLLRSGVVGEAVAASRV